jgi:hypothetical protein
MEKQPTRFDCVAMKHQGAKKVLEQTSRMSLEEEVRFWQASTADLLERQRATKASLSADGASDLTRAA